jgi:hypothetical protein
VSRGAPHGSRSFPHVTRTRNRGAGG